MRLTPAPTASPLPRRTAGGATTSDSPIADAEFDALMARVGPFEASPRVAVGVSGGADSMALALLGQDWACAKGGTAVALTVDHRLRPGSAAEARKVAASLGKRSIEHHVLTWSGPKPAANIQAAARAARLRLLTEWCREHGVLHLLLAHTVEDQAETLLLRLGRGSGLDGLSGMAVVAEQHDLRIARPLLDVSRARLVAALQARGQDWLDDPSNRDPRHARVRMRALMPALAAEGLTAARLAETAGRLARTRSLLDDNTAALLARGVRLDPAGFAWLDGARLAAAPAEIGERALARVIVTVAGGDYAPRRERLARLHADIVESRLDRARTLGGCRIVPRRGAFLVCREPAAAQETIAVGRAGDYRWDGRFRLRIAGAARGLTIARLGRDGWREIVAQQPELRACAIPDPARAALPAVRRQGAVIAAPHLGFVMAGGRARGSLDIRADFVPAAALAAARFGVV